jgi:hypothetical protein
MPHPGRDAYVFSWGKKSRVGVDKADFGVIVHYNT